MMKNILAAISLLTLSAAVVLLICLHFSASGDRDLSGEWTAELDMTKQAAVSALIWLQDMEAVSVSLEDMESYMPELILQINLTLEQTGHSGGTFSGKILPESYDACSQAAYEAFAGAFRELAAERLRMAGYTGGIGQEDIEALVTETFGMSTVSYLMSCGPSLLPPLQELQAQYDGSGVYEAADDILIRRFDAGPATEMAEHYIRKGAELILLEETASGVSGLISGAYPIVYTLKDTGEK
ncbi:MAG: hypothetical protein NC341_06505 [Blautia sp.]|nr:hypothetical protein [Blautia sp.]